MTRRGETAGQKISLLRDAHRGARIKGIALTVTAVTLFSGLDTSAKVVSRDIPILEVVWFRYALHFIAAAIILNPWRFRGSWRVRSWTPQLLRAVSLTLVTAFNFMALQYLQLAETVSIFFLGPLLIAGLSVLFLGEKIGMRRLTAIVVGFIGVIIITRPGSGSFHWAVIFSLGSVLCYAGYSMLTRFLAATETPGSMLLVMAGVPTLGLLPFLPAVWVWPTALSQWLLLLACGFFGGIGHFLVILAHRYAPASILAPFNYAQVLSMVLLGYLVFDNVPNLSTVAGAAVVIASGLYLFHRDRVVRGGTREAPPSLGS